MPELIDKVESHLRAEGYTVWRRGRDQVVGTRPARAQDVDQTFVWVPQLGDASRFGPREGGYLARFKEAADASPTALKYFLVPSLEGLSPDFRQGAPRWYNVRILTPILFFDTDFKWDASRQAASAAKDHKDRGTEILRKRVQQPYRAHDGDESGADLLDGLFRRLTIPGSGQKPIQIVIGPAGIGKSYLFDGLFALLHEAFMDYKQKGGPPSPRPLPLLPEYLQLADAATVRSLLTAFLQTDFAHPLRRETFEWMLTNGHGVWMLDGLDEVISRDPSFFDYLLDLVTYPNATVPPSIVVCVRDSLLETNEAFREFIQEYPDQVATYELIPWDSIAKRRFADIALRDKAPGFMNEISRHPSLDSLAEIPYYCALLADEYSSGKLGEQATETSVLERAVNRLIDRDYDKQFMDRAVVAPNTIVEFYEVMATENYENGFRGVPVDTAVMWADIVLPELEVEQRNKFTGGLVNLAAFAQGTPGHIRFAQEILERYMLGRNLISLFEHSSDTFLRRISVREIPPDWLTVRMLADYVNTTERFQKLLGLVYEVLARPAAFRNALQIAASAARKLGSDELRALMEVPLERQNLGGLKFAGLDLTESSFRECDLTNVVFERCRLRRADFSGAILLNTAFLDLERDALMGAKLGDMTTFFSIRVGRGREISDPAEADRWFEQQTGDRRSRGRICSSALQLRHLFNKFVQPDGKAKRDTLDRRATLRGRRFSKSPEDVLDAAIRHGYLVEEERFRDRIHRPEGDRYTELVAYATSIKLSPGLRTVLDDVCEEENCPHVSDA